MGNITADKITTKLNQPIPLFSTQKQLKVLQWRANSTQNQFIPKVFIQFSGKQYQQNFFHECKVNKNLPIKIKFQNFIGNLNLLKDKLSLQQSLYVLKSLLSGYQAILSYFGKTVVHPNFCFLTKQGQVKAWINSDFRKNTFESQNSGNKSLETDGQQLFLKPPEWINKIKQTSTAANVINETLGMVSDLTFEKDRYECFEKKLKIFALENMQFIFQKNRLKNYDISRIIRFINKFIYHKKLFVKSNLLQAIQRIYNEHQKENQAQLLQFKEPNVNQGSKMSRNTHQNDKRKLRNKTQYRQSIVDDENLVRQSQGKSFISSNQNNCREFAKKSSFFESTLESYGNNRMSTISKNNCDDFRNEVSPNKYINNQQFSTKFRVSQHSDGKSLNRNYISPQFSYNHYTSVSKNTLNPVQPARKVVTVVSTPKNVFFENRNSGINIKRSVNQRSRNNLESTNSIGSIRNSTSLINFKSLPKSTQKVQAKKESMISIQQNIENNFSFTVKKQTNNFNPPTRESLQKFNNAKSQYLSPHKMQKNSIIANSTENFNPFTMKTITKLISSSGQISDQHQSQGDFPSNQNISSYEGILVSMGRSAKIIQIPSVKRISFKNDKKLKTMFTSTNTPNRNSIINPNIFGETY